MQRIAFGQTYLKEPSIAVGLNHFDFSRDHNLRITANTSDVDKRGMTAKLESWADTIMYESGISYFELSGKFQDDVQTGTVSITMGEKDTRHGFNWEFPEGKNPTVIIWFKNLDMDHTKDYSIRSYTNDPRWGLPDAPVDTRGFGIKTEIHGSYYAPPGLPHLYSGEVTWIAVAQNAPGICCGIIDNVNDNGQYIGQGQDVRTNFPRPFRKTPRVLVAFNAISMQTGYYLRLRSVVGAIDINGFSWQWQSWDDTVIRDVLASYVAYEE